MGQISVRLRGLEDFFSMGCYGYLAYVLDSRVETTSELSRVPIVQDFPNIFPEEFLGMPPEMQVEFRIDLMHVAALIANAPYRLAMPEMQELSA